MELQVSEEFSLINTVLSYVENLIVFFGPSSLTVMQLIYIHPVSKQEVPEGNKRKSSS
jgi:hypothetical protein